MKNGEASPLLFSISLNTTIAKYPTWKSWSTQDCPLSPPTPSPCPSHTDFSTYLGGTPDLFHFCVFGYIVFSSWCTLILMFKFFWKKRFCTIWYIILNQNKWLFIHIYFILFLVFMKPISPSNLFILWYVFLKLHHSIKVWLCWKLSCLKPMRCGWWDLLFR